MLPSKIDPADVKWVLQQLACIPLENRIKACEGYAKVWQKAYDDEQKPHCKENAGRYAANTRLRHYVAKIRKAMA